ncbi:MAG TPA: aminotransferase class IV [Planctomycetaceae bacterium]|nr:aminotransferase class IV [Planctomycetaceae bacterium]
MTSPIAWMNGKLIPFAQAGLPLWDLGVVAGASVSEMARTFAHRPFQLPRHLNRLLDSLRKVGFPTPFNREQLLQATEAVLAHNLGLISAHRELGIVVFSTAGANATYLGTQAALASQPTTVVHTFELPFEIWRPQLREGVRLRIPSVRQIPDDCFDVALKVRNRLHWWLADQEAGKLEPGSKALLLDHAGFLTETSTAALHLVCDGRILMPDRSVLNSLSSQLVEELASSIGIATERRPVPPDEIQLASEAFLSSSAAGLLPVSHIQGEPIGQTLPGPVFGQLAKAWSELVGVDIVRQILQEE